MTLVDFKFAVPTVLGKSPTGGGLIFTPTRRYSTSADPETVVLPKGFPARVPASGLASVDLEPNGLDWCWEIKGSGFGIPAWTEYVLVPEGGAVPYKELARVDPKTLEPSAAPDPAWWAALEQAGLGVHATVDPDDPDVLVLHYQSWQTDPADDLILIMPIQGAQ
ncbi:hypothetical protein [Paeniglutamicibacter sp.]|uniref:hypothetical protein n=1 Tax=Paeniglutamicibacter sp. TaxID=1934391 RepID=UPI003989BB71